MERMVKNRKYGTEWKVWYRKECIYRMERMVQNGVHGTE